MKLLWARSWLFTALNLSNEPCPFIMPQRSIWMAFPKLTALFKKLKKDKMTLSCFAFLILLSIIGQGNYQKYSERYIKSFITLYEIQLIFVIIYQLLSLVMIIWCKRKHSYNFLHAYMSCIEASKTSISFFRIIGLCFFLIRCIINYLLGAIPSHWKWIKW